MLRIPETLDEWHSSGVDDLTKPEARLMDDFQISHDSDARRQNAAKKLLREARSRRARHADGGSGDPYCSLVNVATSADGSPLLLMSRLAIHTKNMLADPRVSLMLDERKEGDPLQGARVMLMGAHRPHAGRERPAAVSRAAAGSVTCSWISRISRSTALLSAARIWSRASAASSICTPADILTDLSGADDLLAAEASALAHMNDDHADAVRLYATQLLGAPDGEWRCAGCDPEGLDLQLGRMALRLPFPQRVTAPSRVAASAETTGRTRRGNAADSPLRAAVRCRLTALTQRNWASPETIWRHNTWQRAAGDL